MDPSEYRKRYAELMEQSASETPAFEELLARSSPQADEAQPRTPAAGVRSEQEIAAAVAILLDRGADPVLRASALEAISIQAAERHDLLDLLIGIVRDDSTPVALRLKALDVLSASRFRAATFAPKRAEYLHALRSVVDDPEPAIREEALETLAEEKDEYAQRRLLDGLRDTARALVAPEIALQFLGYDIHAEYFGLLRDLVHNPPNAAARLEAVRLLASDPASTGLLRELVADKREPSEIRTVSAAALQSLAPEAFAMLAEQLAGEARGDEQRSAAADFAAPGEAAEEADFLERLEQLKRVTTGVLRRHAAGPERTE